jgi:hypothetical protein
MGWLVEWAEGRNLDAVRNEDEYVQKNALMYEMPDSRRE